ncbi:hypothetical protein M9458_037101 [Cirrhinus mrigala]|uniref:Uncharacterized protein n=1 Tax=Cirrhinus mrigala TaxID=683832 RepID=A0ABD0P4D4_CIRMR
MDPTVLLILLKQGERSLEDHTRDYIFLAEHSHFPDSSLCKFYYAGLNTTTKALLSGEGPQESLPEYIEWVLASCGSSWTIDIIEEDVIPTLDPEPSQPAPRHAEFEPEPTADDEPEPRATELKIATEPEPYTSDQVRESATATVTGECNMVQVRAMESPAHCTTAGGELEDNSEDLIDFSTEVLENYSGDLIDFFTEISTCHVMPACMESPPTLPLLPTSTSVCSPLSPDSPSAHPSVFHLCSGRAAGLPASIGVRAGGSLISASSLRVQNSASALRPCGSTTALSALVSIVGHRSTSSTVSSAPPWSVVVPPSPQDSVPLAAPRHFVLPAPKDSTLPPAQPPSSVAPAPPRTSGSPPTPWSPEPELDLRLFISASGSFTSCSASVGRPPGVISPSSTMAPPSISSTVGHHGCVLGPARFLLLRVPPVSSLAPPTIVTALDFVFCPYHSVFLSPSRGSVLRRSLLPHGLCFCCFFAPLVCFVFCFLRREDAPIWRGA